MSKKGPHFYPCTDYVTNSVEFRLNYAKKTKRRNLVFMGKSGGAEEILELAISNVTDRYSRKFFINHINGIPKIKRTKAQNIIHLTHHRIAFISSLSKLIAIVFGIGSRI